MARGTPPDNGETRDMWREHIRVLNPKSWAVLFVLFSFDFSLHLFLPVVPVHLSYAVSMAGWFVVLVSFLLILGGQTMLTAALARPGVRGELVTWGAYSHSRNPMCLGFTMLFFGIGLAHDHFWYIVAGLFTLPVMHYLIVLPEERQLDELFGTRYRDYKKKTARWL